MRTQEVEELTERLKDTEKALESSKVQLKHMSSEAVSKMENKVCGILGGRGGVKGGERKWMKSEEESDMEGEGERGVEGEREWGGG